MPDDGKDSSITLRLNDPKLWALIAVLTGVQIGAGQISTIGVSANAEKAVEKQESIDDKLDKIRSAQDQFMGEVRYRLANIEHSASTNRSESQEQIRDLKAAVEEKGKR